MNRSLFFISLLLLGFACNHDTQHSSNESVMYEASELATLMRNMHDSMAIWKEQLVVAGDTSFVYPELFNNITTATPTNPDEINDPFYGMANHYLSAIESFTLASQEERIDNYNLIVTSCVNCHKMYCQGPIPKIKKLTIPQ